MSADERAQEDADRRARLRVVALGIDAEQFLRSDLGRHLVERSEEERTDALEALKDADPEDAKAIRKLQNRIAVLDTWQQWIADAITNGQAMEHALVVQEAEGGPEPPPEE